MATPQPPHSLPRHEKDPRWTAVDNYALAHTHSSSHSPSPKVLEQITANSLAAGLPDIACPRSLGKFMGLQCRLKNVTHALEVGTLGGYSSVWLASMNPGMRVTTIEVSEVHAKVARQNIKLAGVEGRVEVIVGAGVEVLPKLLEEVKEGRRARYGFAFIDADKPNNWNYMDYAVKLGGSGMVVIVDNVVRQGAVASEDDEVRKNDNVAGARRVIENAGKDERVEAVVMQTVGEKNYDGFLYAVVK